MTRLWVILLLLTYGLAVVAQVASNEDTGLKPYGSFAGSDIDSVNLANGNVTLHIPLLSYPQRGGNLSLAFFIRYNNKEFTTVAFNPGGVISSRWEWDGSGVEVGREQTLARRDKTFQETDNYGNRVWIHTYSILSADGAVHQFGNNSSWTLDGTGYRRLSATNTLNRFGTLYVQDSSTTDSNGNQILISPSGWTDTIGRFVPGTNASTSGRPQNGDTYEGTYPGVPTADLTGCPTGSMAARDWNVPAFGSTTATYKLCFGTYSYSTAFGVSWANETSGTATLMNAVILPNGHSWTFEYDNAYMDLVAVHLPTGGTISYHYINAGINGRAVDSRAVNDGTTSRQWLYAYTSYNGYGTTTVTDPEGGVSAHTFNNGYETQVQWRSGTGAVLKTVQTEYANAIENPYDT